MNPQQLWTLDMSAAYFHELYEAFKTAGFDSAQALMLTGVALQGNIMANAQTRG